MKPDDDSDTVGTEIKNKTSDPSNHQGKLILDATVVGQAIRFPIDLGLLNEAREISEQIIDALHPHTPFKKKPRTYHQKARKDYLGIVKRRRPGKKLYRKGNKQQLQYLRRNLKQIEQMLDNLPSKEIPLSRKRRRQYWIIQTQFSQQPEIHRNKKQRCDDRIVSISQPHVRPIIRSKQNKAVEFGAKLSVSLTRNIIACVDELRWDAFHETKDLTPQVEAHLDRLGYYPEKFLADPPYGTRANRRDLKEKGIHFAGKPMGRPKKETDESKAQLKLDRQHRHKDYTQRIPIEGKFDQSKSTYGLGKIKAKKADTSFAWINSIFFVMNLLVLAEVFYFPEFRARLIGFMRTLMHKKVLASPKNP